MPKPLETPAPSALDREIAAMKTIAKALDKLTPASQARVMAHVSQLLETGKPSELEAK